MIAALGGLAGLAFYLRVPLVAGGAGTPPPVNWGYADNWAGFWWLVSGAPYRGYLFGLPASAIFPRLAAWACTLTVQYTPLGLGIALVGLGYLDRFKPALRNFSLLWTIPISLYAIGYNTRDSDIYLLPVIWLCALWIAVGLAACADWIHARWPHNPRTTMRLVTGLTLIGVAALLAVRFPQLSLRQDDSARKFVQGVVASVPANCILVSSDDDQTFALWYGAWAGGELLKHAPQAVLVNYSLYQFPWYRRLLGALYPNVPGIDVSFEQLLAADQGARPIFFSEMLEGIPSAQLRPVGPLWQYVK